jgi:protein-S-isoprenylcysteine O-methyltransferase Ste14
VVVDYAFAAAQFEQHGVLTTPMCLVFAFQFLYVADYFLHEEAILTTWDIKHERLGWMLVWGDLVWVPFIYSLQAQYLVEHTHELPWWGTAAIVALNLAGYAIFRGANWQKHQFRKDPDAPVWGRKPEYLVTRHGTLLLASGWWGIARHVNYLGDLMMALAWCLPCLFEQPLPYFYFAYFLILLLQRERRDHAACSAKYGADWEAYCTKVPWRIIPHVY